MDTAQYGVHYIQQVVVRVLLVTVALMITSYILRKMHNKVDRAYYYYCIPKEVTKNKRNKFVLVRQYSSLPMARAYIYVNIDVCKEGIYMST